MAPLVLASRSPQRRAILEQIGVDFLVRAPAVDEVGNGAPDAVARENARRKALAVARPGETVLGADTVVALGATLYGQPADDAAARRTLAALSGRAHVVVTGICLVRGDETREAVARTRVVLRPLGAPELDWYLETDEWRGRAGAYAIQGKGAALVETIHGDYTNVVGLPVTALMDLAPELVRPARRGV